MAKRLAFLVLLLVIVLTPCYGDEEQGPTRAPTRRPPTRPPTRRSRQPSPPETLNAPTRRPTRPPTRKPTPKPTPQPGEQPLFLQLEINPPTAEPSSSPSDLPSSVPTEAKFNEQSTLPMQQILVSEVAMMIGGIVLPLGKEPEAFLEVLTSDNVARSIIQVLGKDNIENLEVDVSLIPPAFYAKERDPRLDDGVNETLLFDMLIGIQSVIWVHDANRYIVGAFNQLSERTTYLERLKDTGYAEFENVTFMNVSPVRNVTVLSPKPGATEDNSQVVAIAIVIPTVIAIALAIVGFAVYKRRQQQMHKRDDDFRTDRVIKQASNHGFDDDCSKLNMVVNTTMDTSNMSILEDPSYAAHTNDMIVDTGDVSTLGGDGISRPNSDRESVSRISEEDKVSVDFDFNEYRIRAGIPALDDNTVDESLFRLSKSKPPVKSSTMSDDGSSAVAGMSLLSETMSLDFDYHGSAKPKPTRRTEPLPISYDDYYTSRGMVVDESKATTPSSGSAASLEEGNSTIPGTSLMGDTRLSLDYDRERTSRSFQNDRLEARTIVLRRSFDNESKEGSAGDMVILDDTFMLGRELEKVDENFEEEFSVTDSLPRISETPTVGLGRMESVNEEDISVTDSLPHTLGAFPIGRPPRTLGSIQRGSLKKDMLQTDVPHFPDSLSRKIDSLSFRLSNRMDMPATTHNSTAKAMMAANWDTTSSLPTSEGSARSSLFEVTAAKGILGLALEDTEQGAPAVKTVHNSSPLSRKVRAGDWLVKLDGIDVTSMPTSDVVRLISAKKDQKERRFMFARTEDAMDIEEESIYIA